MSFGLVLEVEQNCSRLWSVKRVCMSRNEGIFDGLTSAWKEETEKMPSRPMASLVGREAKPSRRLGLGGSQPCRLAR